LQSHFFIAIATPFRVKKKEKTNKQKQNENKTKQSKQNKKKYDCLVI